MEWAAAAIGVALVTSTLVFLMWLGFTRGDSPPDVSLHVDSIVPMREGYVVTLRAVNSGDTTAADVTVEGRLAGASGIAETAEMTFRYLPPRSERRGGLFFSRDPRQLEVKLKAKGYETP